jgi:heptaprenyl diphosphate synthase
MTRLSGKEKEYSNKTLALLGACCLFLSAIEYMIPKPLPFMRIGLANLPLMLALDILPFPAFITLILIKVMGQALITGTLFSYVFLFSAAGTFFSAMVMYALRLVLKERVTYIGIGTAGAIVSNSAQLALAYIFIFRESVMYIAPLFFAAGLVTGIALGVFCEIYAQRSQWFGAGRSNLQFGEQGTGNRKKGRENKGIDKLFSARALCITGLLILPALLFNPSTEYRVYQFLFFWFLVWASGRSVNFLFTFLFIATIIAFNLLIPYGQILFSLGPFKITSGSLTAGIHRAVTFSALIMISKLSIRQDLQFPGTFGGLLGESLGIFSAMMGKKKRVMGKRKSFIEKIDEILMEAGSADYSMPSSAENKTTPVGYLILFTVLVISWLPWFFLNRNFPV